MSSRRSALYRVGVVLILSWSPAAADDIRQLQRDPDFALHYDFGRLAQNGGSYVDLLRWAERQPRLGTGRPGESCSVTPSAGIILAWKHARALYTGAPAFDQDRQRVLAFMDRIDADTRVQIAAVPAGDPVSAELRRRVLREQPWAGAAVAPWLAENPDTASNGFQLFFGLLKARACAEQLSNTSWLKQTLRRLEWPRERAAEDAWLIGQHSDHDVPFQQEALARLGRAYAKDPALGQDYAYLQDRVLVRLGRPQIYGTQFQAICGGNRPYPIEDEAGLDARRAKVGLGPWAAYERQIGKPCRTTQ